MRLFPMRHLLWIPLIAATPFPANAVEVAGKVQTKLGAAIAGAQVCVKSQSGACVATGAHGEFRLSNSLALRPAIREVSGYSMVPRGGALILESPVAVSARMEWLSADGKSRWAVSDLRLAAGSNVLSLPAGLPHAGLCILRLTTPGASLAWQAILVSGSASSAGRNPSGAARVAALSKSMAAMLEISKPGYRTRIYQPSSEEDTAAVIQLSESGDTGIGFSGVQHTKILSIDRSRKLLITADSDFYCDPQTGSLVVEPMNDTAHYAIRSGAMWIWQDGDCSGTLFLGAATDPVGDWVLTEPDVPLPVDLQTGCTPFQDGYFARPFESMSAEYTITETGITAAASDRICPGEYFASVLATESFDDSSVRLMSSKCLELGYKNRDGDTGTFKFAKAGDSLLVTFAHKAGTCRTSEYFGLSDRTFTCPIDYTSQRQTFIACVADAGFGQLDPLRKVAIARTTIPSRTMNPKSAPPQSHRAPRHGLGRLLEYISGR